MKEGVFNRAANVEKEPTSKNYSSRIYKYQLTAFKISDIEHNTNNF
jgi:hypothetical protein